VVGNASKGDTPSLMTLVDVKYQQGEWNQCLFKATASVLHYCGLEHASYCFSITAATVKHLPHPKVIKILRDQMIKHALEMAGLITFN
jgi:hypothetical protein